jgi:hypothetical protein
MLMEAALRQAVGVTRSKLEERTHMPAMEGAAPCNARSGNSARLRTLQDGVHERNMIEHVPGRHVGTAHRAHRRDGNIWYIMYYMQLAPITGFPQRFLLVVLGCVQSQFSELVESCELTGANVDFAGQLRSHPIHQGRS